MEIIYSKKLPRILKNKKRLESLLGVKITNRGKEIKISGKPEDEYVEAWTAMTGIGVQTTKLRIGQIVLFNSLRNPASPSVSPLDISQILS